MREAAVVAEISEQAVAHRMSGALGITPEEESRLLGLWRDIRSSRTLDNTYPFGAVQQQMAYREAAALLIGDEVDPEVVSWSAWQAVQDERANVRDPERKQKPIPEMHGRKGT